MYKETYKQYKYRYCLQVFMKLAEDLKDTHEIIGSCNKDRSIYLIPKGSIDDLSYYGKPVDSYRISDHWNWYASITRCSDEGRIQCHNVDLKYPQDRIDGRATRPVSGVCIAYYDIDGKYHTVFGELYDKAKRKNVFLDNLRPRK